MLLLTGWNWQPWIVASIALAAIWYALGVSRLRRRAAASRPFGGARIATYYCGLGVLFVILVSPVDSVGDQLFWVHMVQHLGLLLAVPPLLVIGRPVLAFLWAFDRRWRRRMGWAWQASGLHAVFDTLMHPLLVWTLFCGAFIVWHCPGPHQWAQRNEMVHTVEHLCLFASALMFWSVIIEPPGQHRRLGYGPTLVFVVSAAILSALPGALIALAPRPLYPAYAPGEAAWGATLLEDQQLAGIVMWVPGGVVYLAAAAWIFLRWLQEDERRTLWLTQRVLLPVAIASLLPLSLGACGKRDEDTVSSRGVMLVRAYGCGGCHTIPGITEANGVVGPPLSNIGSRVYIAGLLPNTPDNLAIWLRNPQAVVPGNVMPNMHIDERDARDIATYLYALK